MIDTFTYQVLKAVVSLLIVLVAMVGVLYVMRIFISRSWQKNQAVPVRIITTAFIGQRKNIAIVDVAGELLVLGITPTSMVYLTRIERPEAIETLRRIDREKTRTFFNVLEDRLRTFRMRKLMGSKEL